jgi:integrase
MASLRARDGNLFFDFRFHGERCREYLHVPDTPANREALQPTLDKLNRDLAMGTLDYIETFPNSPRVMSGAIDRLGPRAQTGPHPAPHPAHRGAEVKGARKATPTTAKFAEVWFSESKVSWRATYVTTVRDILDNHILVHFESWRVDEITRAELLNFRATVAAKRGKKPGSTLSPVRVNTIMLITKQLLEEAADRYEFTCPFVRIKPLKVPKSDIQPFTLEEVQRILNGVRPDFRTYFLVRFFTGMRTGEIDGLKWKYVDFEKRQILIRETIVRGEEEYTKTDSSQREIQMNSLVYDALLAHQKLTRTRSDYVFCSPNGSLLDHANVTKRIWYPTLHILGIAPRRPYQTRHTAATMWLAAGENPEWIARQMGHANTEMLFTVYSRFVPNLTRRDGSALEKLIAPIFKPDAELPDVAQAANDSSATDSPAPLAEHSKSTPNPPTKTFSRNPINRKL